MTGFVVGALLAVVASQGRPTTDAEADASPSKTSPMTTAAEASSEVARTEGSRVLDLGDIAIPRAASTKGDRGPSSGNAAVAVATP